MFRFNNIVSNKDFQAFHRIHSDRGSFSIHNRIRADFNLDGLTFNRAMGVSQQFTLVGRPRLFIAEADSSLDGISSKYLTIEGAVSTDSILTELRTTSGLPPQAIANHAQHLVGWRWYDNHVTLLINMMRAYLLKDLAEQGQLTTGIYPIYNDGHVRIDLNKEFGYEDHDVEFYWPGKEAKDQYPHWTLWQETTPTTDDIFMDLRALTNNEAEFVLAMLGPWQRQTNYAMDFELPALCSRLAYRYPTQLTALDEWIEGTRADNNCPMPTATVMLSAIRKYVNQNKLYNQFFTAMNLLSQFIIKPVPNNAEGHAWLYHQPQVVLPKFGSVRGRYNFLLNGEAALIQATALEDWGVFSSRPDFLFSYATTVSLTLNLGLYMRRVLQKCFTDRLDDGYEDGLFLTPETFAAAAMSLGSGVEAPLNGMSNTYVYYPELVDLDATTSIPARVEDPSGYDITERGIAATGVPLSASPFSVYPLAIFTDANPFSGAFTVPRPQQYARGGALYSKWDAWKLAWAARIAGYDVSIKVPYDTTGLSKFFADNRDSWTHIPEGFFDQSISEVLLTGFEMRNRHFVELPRMVHPAFAKEFGVTIRVYDEYLEAGPAVRDRGIMLTRDFVSPLSTGIQVITSGNLQKYWGTVRRSDQGLGVAGFTMPAVIPTADASAGAMIPEDTEDIQEDSQQ